MHRRNYNTSFRMCLNLRNSHMTEDNKRCFCLQFENYNAILWSTVVNVIRNFSGHVFVVWFWKSVTHSKAVPGTCKAPSNEDVWGSGGTVPLFLDLTIRWR